MSAPAARFTIRRHEWVLAGLAALLAFVIPMTVAGWLDDPAPELRVLKTSRHPSTLIVDGDARILVIQSDDREATGAMLGRIAQPWEARPQAIVSSSEDDAAIGLWEALQRLEPATVVVAGIPGANPLWATIDAECANRRIELRYIADRATLATERLDLTVFGTGVTVSDGGRGVIVRRGDLSLVIALDRVPPAVDGQVLIFDGDPSPATPDLLVTSDDAPRSPRQHELLVNDRQVVRLELGINEVRAYGGVLRPPAAP